MRNMKSMKLLVINNKQRFRNNLCNLQLWTFTQLAQDLKISLLFGGVWRKFLKIKMHI